MSWREMVPKMFVCAHTHNAFGTTNIDRRQSRLTSSKERWCLFWLKSSRKAFWQIAARRSTYKKLGKGSALYKAKRNIEKAKAQARAKVEHPFRVIKRQFGYMKTRFRGLAKNTAQLVTLFALSNLWMARRHLLRMV